MLGTRCLYEGCDNFEPSHIVLSGVYSCAARSFPDHQPSNHMQIRPFDTCRQSKQNLIHRYSHLVS